MEDVVMKVSRAVAKMARGGADEMKSRTGVVIQRAKWQTVWLASWVVVFLLMMTGVHLWILGCIQSI